MPTRGNKDFSMSVTSVFDQRPTLGVPTAVKDCLFLAWDKIYLEICILALRFIIWLQSVPFLTIFSRRMTFMSAADTNANMCLFLRQLYSIASAPITYDPQESYFASMFLEIQYKVMTWIVTHFGWRLLPPLLRPIFKAYYGRARYAGEFVNKSIEEYKVDQIIVLGAGFDSNAYRSRNTRIIRDGKLTKRFIRVFEVDRSEVHDMKVRGLRTNMSVAEWEYYTEGVVFVICNFGVDSVKTKLLEAGLDPLAATSVLWEGVTYYLDRAALRTTLFELRDLFAVPEELNSNFPVHDSTRMLVTEKGSTPISHAVSNIASMGTSSVSPSTAASNHDELSAELSLFGACTRPHKGSLVGNVYLFMDYMLQKKTLSCCATTNRSWKLAMLTADSLGIRFISGFVDARSCDCRILPRTTCRHERLNCMECVFIERERLQYPFNKGESWVSQSPVIKSHKMTGT